ncbi:hypothetical protein KJ680_03060 [bacterium]|nr:hypothetical protein [bacterium]
MTLKLFIFVIVFSQNTLYAQGIAGTQPSYNTVYRSDRIGDSYHFFLLTKDGMYYHLHTNRTDTITADEIKSPNILNILKQKQSWGQSFPKKGAYTISNGKLYTKLLWDQIKIISKNEINYLNKTFYIK